MDADLIELTTSIVASYVEHNNIAVSELPGLISSVHAALSGAGRAEAPADESVKLSASQIRKSIAPDHLVSFVDGKKYKTLKRHLAVNGLTFADYKAKFGLPDDYPSVAPSYSAQRSALAKQLGLGQGGRGAAPAPAVKAVKAKAPRKKAAAAQ